MSSDNTKRYIIGGVRIRIDADFAIGSERNFELFEAEFDGFDVAHSIKKADVLPIPEGRAAISEPLREIFVGTDRAQICHRSLLGGKRIYAVTELGAASAEISTLADANAAEEYENSRVIFRTFEIPHLLLKCGGILLHASMIEHDGQAILFTAPSGVGKSTQAAIWHDRLDADIINGDQALIRFVGGGQDAPPRAFAHGVPYCGSSGICRNVSLPIRAIVSLEQAADNRAVPMSRGSAMAALLAGATAHSWFKSDMERLMDAAARTVESVPFIKLYCTADVRAANALLGAL